MVLCVQYVVFNAVAPYADREFTEEEQKARDRYAELYAGYKKETDEEKKQVIEAGGLCILGTEHMLCLMPLRLKRREISSDFSTVIVPISTG